MTGSGHDGVTVITATRGRPELLARALRSVAGQCCRHVAEHLVLVDDCPDTLRSLAAGTPPLVRVEPAPRGPGEVTGPRRLGRLRQLGAETATTRWIAFLDDDNEWRPDHLHRLLDTARRTEAPAVHSWLQVVDAAGRPYLDPVFPWVKDDERGRREYERLRGLGVVTPGSNVYRDRADRGDGPADIQSVDGGEWLLDRELALSVGFEFEFTEYDRDHLVADDDKFLAALLRDGAEIACTQRATLVYRLGGFSTSTAPEDQVSWL